MQVSPSGAVLIAGNSSTKLFAVGRNSFAIKPAVVESTTFDGSNFFLTQMKDSACLPMPWIVLYLEGKTSNSAARPAETLVDTLYLVGF